MESQDKFLEPLLNLHKYYDQTWCSSLRDLTEALAVFLRSDRQSVKIEVDPATLKAALDITGCILNFKQHIKKVMDKDINESALIHDLKCEEIIDILFTRLFVLAESHAEHMEVKEKKDKIRIYLQDLICIAPIKYTVSV